MGYKFNIGDVLTTNNDGDVVIVDIIYVGMNRKYVVKFIDTDNEYTVPHSSLKNGYVRDSNRDRTTQFVDDCIRLHGDKYNYQKTVFKTVSDKVVVICPEHGEFSILASAHKRGQGCRLCGIKKVTASRTFSTEDFIAQSISKFGNRYDYSKTNYVNAKTKVVITCPVHGDFTISPDEHLSTTNGCPSCGKVLRAEAYKTTFEQFVQQAIEIHGDKYSYNRETFDGMKNYTTITCKEHGDWSVIAAHHTSNESGCPCCVRTGFNQSLPGYVYVLDNGDFIKVGITNKDPEQRCSRINQTAPSKFEVKYSIPLDGKTCAWVERETHNWLENNGHKRPQQEFPGWTECFDNVSLHTVVEKISQLGKEHGN